MLVGEIGVANSRPNRVDALSGHCAAETNDQSLVIDESELANSMQNGLGAINGHHEHTVHANALKRFGLRALIMLANQQVVAGTGFEPVTFGL